MYLAVSSMHTEIGDNMVIATCGQLQPFGCYNAVNASSQEVVKRLVEYAHYDVELIYPTPGYPWTPHDVLCGSVVSTAPAAQWQYVCRECLKKAGYIW